MKTAQTRNLSSIMRGFLLLTGSLLLIAGSAEAALITVTAFGHIDSVDDNDGLLPSPLMIGAPFIIDYTYDTKTMDSRSDNPDVGFYAGAVLSMTVTLNSTPILLDLSSAPEDRFVTYEVVPGNYQALGRSKVINSTGSAAYLALENLFPGTLSSDALKFPPPLGAVQLPGVQLYYQSFFGGLYSDDVRGTVDQISFVSLPEPRSFSLIALGCSILLAACNWRRKLLTR